MQTWLKMKILIYTHHDVVPNLYDLLNNYRTQNNILKNSGVQQQWTSGIHYIGKK